MVYNKIPYEIIGNIKAHTTDEAIEKLLPILKEIEATQIKLSSDGQIFWFVPEWFTDSIEIDGKH